jgi:hypothetical protein
MICFLVTTYNRPKTCEQLVKKLVKEGDVYLLGDGSYYEWIDKYDIDYRYQDHKGKRLYTETVNDLFKMPEGYYSCYFMIPDDFIPVPGFVDKAINTWNRIDDEVKICLTTYVDKGRKGKPCWTGIEPIESRYYRQTQWTDMCFMCTQKFFGVLGDIPPSKINWGKRPEMSSGVGSLISSHLHREGWHLYQTKKSLFIPQKVKSEMNEWRTEDDPINKPIL